MKTKIILYGTGLRGEKFYQRWKNKRDICFCIDKRKQTEFHGLKVYSPEDAADCLNDCLIVVAAFGSAYREIDRCLKQLGGRHEFKDFIQD